jgi:PKD repeat protein
MLCLAPPALGAAFTLQWDPNAEPSLAGYRLYYGTASRSYETRMDVGNVNTYYVTGLQDGVRYYFAVTAYDQQGRESGYSNEVTAKRNVPPTAMITAYPSSGRAPLTVTFIGVGTDPDGSVVGYAWDFGDGGFSNNQSPSHTYASQGTFTVTLTVSDDEGATATAQAQIAVYPPNRPPALEASVSPIKGAPPLAVSFRAEASDPDGVISWQRWEFGDGDFSNDPVCSHVYAEEGIYKATITVADNEGAVATRAFEIKVNAAPSRPKGVRFAGSR